MTPLTAEWVEKAEEDWHTLEWLVQSPRGFPAAVGFHAQQCVEKYLKARLHEAGITFPKTHDLEGLAELLRSGEPAIAACMDQLAFLSRFAVEVRYPGIVPSDDEAAEARQACTALRSRLRKSLGLSP